MFLILMDGARCEVVRMFDIDGDETEAMDDACSVVARHPDGSWVAQEVGPEMRVEIVNN